MTVGELCAALLAYGEDREVDFAVTVGGRPSVLRGRDASVSARSTTGEAEDVRVEVAVGDGTAERIPF